MAFSHKKHAALQIPCANCHSTVKKAERAGFPAVSECMVCHQAVLKDRPSIRRLSALPPETVPFPSGPGIRLPDFVFFSHARHGKAGVGCEDCHGAVMEKDSTPEEAPKTMKACIDCHKRRKATLACNACHELNQ